jgi:anti-anti-sigma regulatory factor
MITRQTATVLLTEYAMRITQRHVILGMQVMIIVAGVLFAPIVGHLDSRRTHALTSRLLESVNAQRGKVVIVDIAGVNAIDTAVARGLLNAAQALRLLGCEVVLSGISAEVATLSHNSILHSKA